MIFKKKIAIMALISLFLLSLAAFSAQEYSRDVIIEQSAVCLDCHDDMQKSLAVTTHRITDNSNLKSSIAVGCISCHDGWEEHLEDPSEETISSAFEESKTAQAEICSRCHVTVHQSSMATTDVHGRADLDCSSCHRLHDNHNMKLLLDDGGNFCLTCHTDVKAEFEKRSAHPLNSGNIGCVSCHSMDGLADPKTSAGLDWTCQNCHTDQTGPFIHEHPVAYAHLVEGGGCVECHEPHGSANDRLLAQPNNGTCLQCHGVPTGHRTSHSGLGSKLACVDCHSEIHGSYDNAKLLDPLLGSKLFPDCYQSGCHIVND